MQVETLRPQSLYLAATSYTQVQYGYDLCSRSRTQVQRSRELCSKSHAQLQRIQNLRSKSHAQVQRGHGLCIKSRTQLQRSQNILQQIKGQPWYQPYMERLYQELLIDMRFVVEQAKVLCSTIQSYSDSLADETAPDLQQIRKYNEEIDALLKHGKLSIKRYKLLVGQDELLSNARDEKITAFLRQSFIELEETRQWLINMLEEYDWEYQLAKRMHEITTMISRSI